MISEAILARLKGQLDSLDVLASSNKSEAWEHVPQSGKWSARQNLAHLVRYHEVFLERLQTILTQERPGFGRYRAEDDPRWVNWNVPETEVLIVQLKTLREDVVSLLGRLTREQLTRTGIHPVLGEMDIPLWLEFFLLHEAHHLYVILFRLREAK